ncbi:MAG: cardiolipin synthase ClsB [Myxococcales bacterium]|nr:cardiolipin synthase ClsB [Myxococcales bacterium]MCB9749667.1 cardiolipin synthase ClsB [Myxococcales bacterium]
MSAGGPFFSVGENSIRHLRDAREAYPAMLDAIRGARFEVLLEMYWIAADRVGLEFRDALVERAAAGVTVRVIYDAIGSIRLPADFWEPLLVAGGEVTQFGPISPWRRHFRLLRLRFRDHRKVLVCDVTTAFTGGINLASPWLPVSEGGAAWRDDAVELRGPAGRQLRTLFYDTWWDLSGSRPANARPGVRQARRGVWVLANMFRGRPDRSIRRAYLLAIRRARASIDITACYFLPGPALLRALIAAHRRGVRLRILVPLRSDVPMIDLAMQSILVRLVREGIAVYAFHERVLHSKTGIVDARYVTIGSYNLDAQSLHFNLESNVAIDDRRFAEAVTRSFDDDLEMARRLDLALLRAAPLRTRFLAWWAARLRAFL